MRSMNYIWITLLPSRSTGWLWVMMKNIMDQQCTAMNNNDIKAIKKLKKDREKIIKEKKIIKK